MPDTDLIIWIEVEDAKAVYEQMKARGVKSLSELFRIQQVGQWNL